MQKAIAAFTMLSAMALAGASQASSYEDQVDNCLSKFANKNDAATVMLECTAANGKLSDCKVVSNSSSKGFERAAICVAEFLPMNGKTGTIKVPLRFAGANG